MSAFSARLTGSTPVANVATKSCTASQPEPQPGQIGQTDIVIVVQINLEHRDFVEVGFWVVIDPFDQVLATSAIDSVSHRACRIQGCENTAESERDNQEGLSAGHRAETPVRGEEDGRSSRRRTRNGSTRKFKFILEGHVGAVAPVASMVSRLALGAPNTLLSAVGSCWSLTALSNASHSPNPA